MKIFAVILALLAGFSAVSLSACSDKPAQSDPAKGNIQGS